MPCCLQVVFEMYSAPEGMNEQGKTDSFAPLDRDCGFQAGLIVASGINH
jgi:hypothetical protein